MLGEVYPLCFKGLDIGGTQMVITAFEGQYRAVVLNTVGMTEKPVCSTSGANKLNMLSLQHGHDHIAVSIFSDLAEKRVFGPIREKATAVLVPPPPW